MAEEVELCVEIPPNMEDVWEEALDVDRLCRACANTNESMIPIFEGDGIEHELQAKIAKHLPVKITKEDGLPHQMCFQCASTLVAWHDMFTNCIEAEKKLTNLVNKAKDAKDDEQELQEMEEMEEQVIEEEVIETSIAEDMAIEKFTTDVQERTVREMEMDDDNREDDVEAAREDDVEGIDENSGKKEDRAGTTIRDQLMVLDKDEMHPVCMTLDTNEMTLRLKSRMFAKVQTKTMDHVTLEAARFASQKYLMCENKSRKRKLSTTEYQYSDEEWENDICNNDQLVNDDDDYDDDVDGDGDGDVDVDVDGNGDDDEVLIDIKSEPDNPPPAKGFVCEICNWKFQYRYHLIRHQEARHSGVKPEGEEEVEDEKRIPASKSEEPKIYTCKECGRTYKNYYALRSHKRTHITEKVACDLCGKLYTVNSIYSHMKANHYGTEYKCDFCDKSYKQKASLLEHRRTHIGDLPYVCEICGERKVSKYALSSHMLCHTEERPHACEKCNARFKTRQHLNTHMSTHFQKTFVCDVCGKLLLTKYNLEKHLETHSGLKPYSCHLCPATFNQDRYLTKHLKDTHIADDQKFMCDVCGKKLNTKYSLDAHKQTHSGQKPETCPLCFAKFNQLQYLRKHLRKKHGTRLAEVRHLMTAENSTKFEDCEDSEERNEIQRSLALS